MILCLLQFIIILNSLVDDANIWLVSGSVCWPCFSPWRLVFTVCLDFSRSGESEGKWYLFWEVGVAVTVAQVVGLTWSHEEWGSPGLFMGLVDHCLSSGCWCARRFWCSPFSLSWTCLLIGISERLPQVLFPPRGRVPLRTWKCLGVRCGIEPSCCSPPVLDFCRLRSFLCSLLLLSL